MIGEDVNATRRVWRFRRLWRKKMYPCYYAGKSRVLGGISQKQLTTTCLHCIDIHNIYQHNHTIKAYIVFYSQTANTLGTRFHTKQEVMSEMISLQCENVRLRKQLAAYESVNVRAQVRLALMIYGAIFIIMSLTMKMHAEILDSSSRVGSGILCCALLSKFVASTQRCDALWPMVASVLTHRGMWVMRMSAIGYSQQHWFIIVCVCVFDSIWFVSNTHCVDSGWRLGAYRTVRKVRSNM